MRTSRVELAAVGCVLAALIAGLVSLGSAQYPAQGGVSYQIGIVPRHTHSSDKTGGGTLIFDAILRDGSTNYGPVAGTTNTHTNLGTLSIAGDSLANQDRRYATVGGGLTNYAYAEYSTIGGGFSNQMTTGTATAGTIGGGQSNRAGFQATVGGGRSNEARGNNATIPGGLSNTAEGANAFAAGTQARSRAQGAFTFADSQAADLLNDTTDAMLMRFAGGWEVRAPTSTFPNRVTAGSFVGDGAGLTNLPASGETNTYGSSKTFTAPGGVKVNYGILAATLSLTGAAPALVSSGAVFGATITVLGTNGASIGGNVLIGGSDDQTFRLLVRAASDNYSVHFAQNNGDDGWSWWPDSSLGGLALGRRQSATVTGRFKFTPTGDYGVGTLDPKWRLHVSSGASNLMSGSTGTYVTGTLGQTVARSCTTGATTDAAGNFDGCVASSRKAKTRIKDRRANLAAFDRLRVVNYEMKKDRARRPRLGFIAEEVSELYPDAVVPAGADLTGIDALSMSAVLVQEVQDLRRRVAQLEKGLPPQKPAKDAGAGAAGGAVAGALAAAAVSRRRRQP